jgi:Tfp pilus assembly ATPase PilU
MSPTLGLIWMGGIRVREMITHRLGLAKVGHLCLSFTKIQSPNKSFKMYE